MIMMIIKIRRKGKQFFSNRWETDDHDDHENQEEKKNSFLQRMGNRSLAFQDNLRLHPLPRRERLIQKMGSDFKDYQVND